MTVAAVQAPSPLRSLGLLTHDAFRESIRSRPSWVLASASLLAILLCASLGIEGGEPLRPLGEAELFGRDGQPLAGPNPTPGSLTLGFGAVRVPLFRDGPAMIAFLRSILARGIVGGVGTLVMVIATAGLLPEALRPSAVAAILVRPVPRWTILGGEVLAVLLFASSHAVLFVVGTWVALGLSLGSWSPGFLLAAPLLIAGFAMVYGASVLLACWSRSGPVCVLGTVVFWSLCAATCAGKHHVEARARLSPEASFARVLPGTVGAGYWLLPKPTDLAIVMDRVLHEPPSIGRGAASPGPDVPERFRPGWSIVTSLLGSTGLLLAAARKFEASLD